MNYRQNAIQATLNGITETNRHESTSAMVAGGVDITRVQRSVDIALENQNNGVQVLPDNPSLRVKDSTGVYLSTSTRFFNKSIKNGYSDAYNSFSGRKLSDEQIATHLIEYGGAITPAYLGTRKDYDGGLIPRTKSNFKGSQLIGFDFDNNVSLGDLNNTRLFNEFSFLQHETASSSADCRKTRAYIRLPYAVTSAKQYEFMQKAIHWYIKEGAGLEADSTTDATRLYYGSYGAEHVFKSELYIPVDELEGIIQEYKAVNRTERKAKSVESTFFMGSSNVYAQAGEEALQSFVAGEPVSDGERNEKLFSAIYRAYVTGREELIPQLKSHAEAHGLSSSEVDSVDKSAEKRNVKRLSGSAGIEYKEAKANVWSQLTTAILNHTWTNATAQVIALALAEHTTRQKNVKADGDELYIDISHRLIETITGMSRTTVSKHFATVLDSPFFDTTDLASSYRGQVLRVTVPSVDSLHVAIQASSRHTYKLIHELYNISKNAVLVWSAIARGIDTHKALIEHTGLNKNTVSKTLKTLEDNGYIASEKAGRSKTYTVIVPLIVTEPVEATPSLEAEAEPVPAQLPLPLPEADNEAEAEADGDYIDFVFDRAIKLQQDRGIVIAPSEADTVPATARQAKARRVKRGTQAKQNKRWSSYKARKQRQAEEAQVKIAEMMFHQQQHGVIH